MPTVGRPAPFPSSAETPEPTVAEQVMADVTEEKIVKAVQDIKGVFADGFQLADIGVLIDKATVFAQTLELTGPERRQLALQVIQRVLDETDIPWWPDKLTLPLIGDVGADALIMRFAPRLVDLVVDSASGKTELAQTKRKE